MSMDKLVSSSAMEAIDSAAQKQYKIPALSLMETAALKIWLSLENEIGKNQKLLFLCGGGNNGGDALVIARLAYDLGYENQECILIGNHISTSCAVQREIVKAYGLRCSSVQDQIPEELAKTISDSEIIFDGLSGTGLKGPLQGIARELVLLANQSKAFRIAIDIPSGLGDSLSPKELHFIANHTATLGLSKSAFYHPSVRKDCGKIEVLNPSFPAILLQKAKEACNLVTPNDLKLKKLSSAAFKNSRGHVAILGGSSRYTGAVRLSARAAFSSRSGLVSLFCDPEIFQIAATESPSVMVRILTQQDDYSSFSALLAGPGWGEGRKELLQRLLATKKPLVLDADGIKAYAQLLQNNNRPEHGPLILTPHLGELRILASSVLGLEGLTLGNDDTPALYFSNLRKLAKELEAVLVVKSSLVSIVQSDGQIFVVEGLNPSLGVAGSGDVLSGILVALLGNGLGVDEAAVMGAVIHQNAGRLARESFGYYDSETLLGFVGKAVEGMEQ
jgi:NAD(P)H-hydrate epimerase